MDTTFGVDIDPRKLGRRMLPKLYDEPAAMPAPEPAPAPEPEAAAMPATPPQPEAAPVERMPAPGPLEQEYLQFIKDTPVPTIGKLKGVKGFFDTLGNALVPAIRERIRGREQRQYYETVGQKRELADYERAGAKSRADIGQTLAQGELQSAQADLARNPKDTEVDTYTGKDGKRRTIWRTADGSTRETVGGDVLDTGKDNLDATVAHQKALEAQAAQNAATTGQHQKTMEGIAQQNANTSAENSKLSRERFETPPLTGAQKVAASGKLVQVKLAKAELARMKAAFDKLKNSWSAGPGGGLVPSEQGVLFDKAAATYKQFLVGLTRTPGIGANSDFESRLAVAPAPQRGELYESVTADQIESQMRMLDAIEEGYGGMLGAQQSAAGAAAPPPVGTVVDGYRFKGGDPSKQENWEPVKPNAPR